MSTARRKHLSISKEVNGLPDLKSMKQKGPTKVRPGKNVSGAITQKGVGTKNHQNLLKKVLLKLSEYGYFAWQNSTGAVKSNNRFLRYGLPGSADILGIQPNTGRFIALEVKTGVGVQSKQQKLFQQAIEKRNGIYKVIRKIEEVDEFNAVC